MKFFIAACLREYQENTASLFKQAGIRVFSAANIIGFRDEQPLNLLEDWFASGDESYDAVMLFSFTPAVNAEKALQLVQQYNEKNATGFPIRAFIVPVEQASF